MLLKGLIEVRDAVRPIAAAEMALVRLAYAADLPPTDKLVRDAMERAGSTPAPARGRPARARRPRAVLTTSRGGEAVSAQARPYQQGAAAARRPAPREPVALHSLAEIAGLAGLKGAAVLKVRIENHMHLVRLEAGTIEFRPGPGAPRTLASDLAQKLQGWTRNPLGGDAGARGRRAHACRAEEGRAGREARDGGARASGAGRARSLSRRGDCRRCASTADRDLAPPTDES